LHRLDAEQGIAPFDDTASLDVDADELSVHAGGDRSRARRFLTSRPGGIIGEGARIPEGVEMTAGLVDAGIEAMLQSVDANPSGGAQLQMHRRFARLCKPCPPLARTRTQQP